jgi:pheromone shutdown protein TraB
MDFLLMFFGFILTLLVCFAYCRSFGIKRRYHLIAIFGWLVIMGHFAPVDVPANEILHEPN